MDKMKGKWQVTGIFENFFGEIELDVIHCWPGGLFGSTTTIAVTGDEYPSPIVDVITRRPYKIKLATSRTKRKRSPRIENTFIEAVEEKEVDEDTDWEMLANIVKENQDA
jgi:hypothetical protein